MKHLPQRLTCKNFGRRQRKLCKDPAELCFSSKCNNLLFRQCFLTLAHRFEILWCCLIQIASEKLCRSGCRFWSESLDLRRRIQTWMDQERTDGSGIIWTPAQSNKEIPQGLLQKRQKSLPNLEMKLRTSRHQTLLNAFHRAGVLQSLSVWCPLKPYHQICQLTSPSWPRSTRSWAASETRTRRSDA